MSAVADERERSGAPPGGPPLPLAPEGQAPKADAAPAADLPTAAVVRRPGWWSWAWLAPLAAAALAGVLAFQVWSRRGPEITIRFASGEGLRAGDPVTYRAVQVGEVTAVRLADGLDRVVVTVRLAPDAAGLAVEGSRFWIVRPEVSATGISGLETILGPRYIAVEPGSGPAARRFDGLDAPPPPAPAADGLPLLLRAPHRGSLNPGSPVHYRGIRVGSVTGVTLAPDGRAVEIAVVIRPEHAALVRTNTKFWNASGVGLDVGWWRGVTVKAGSLESIIAGGIGFATPDDPGPRAGPGARFELHPEPKEDWLEWDPALLPGDG